MNYATIKYYDIANGEGVRTSLFVSGCPHHCPECFNAEAWDFNFGRPFDATAKQAVLDSLAPDYIAGLSLLGGEPFAPANQPELAAFLKEVRSRYPQKNIWCYTGYIYETDLLPQNGRAHTPVTADLLDAIAVLVDGPFIKAQADISLKFRGSANQRILNLQDPKQQTATLSA
ncbi:MAG: anaerobic ribonucleoside-triphosphate reductase activating protein [Eubacteriaceae bacterium]|nr:anaerobic ribonucleoside-triphosphate reductase activating protein [Eubacteriaceae bacterium]